MGKLELIPGTQTSGPVWRIASTSATKQVWDVRLEYHSTAPVRKGDRLLLSFWVRAVRPLPAQTVGFMRFSLHLPGEKMPNAAAGLGLEMAWRRYDFPLIATVDAAAGTIYGNFDLGGGDQLLEMRDVELLNYGPDYPLEKLPRTELTYPGREADAPWRKAALERIEKGRKRDLSLLVVDAQGRPLPEGVTVTGSLANPDFRFSTAVSTLSGARYLRETQRLFNAIATENSLKHGSFFSEKGRNWAMFEIGWARNAGLKVHGHVLLWPMWRYLGLPKEKVEELKKNPRALRALLLERIREQLVATRGLVDSWDLANEIAWQREALDILNAGGISDADMIADIVKLARSIDPKLKLQINDQGLIENYPTVSPSRIKFYDDLFVALSRRGVKIDSFGFQGHFHAMPPSPEAVLKVFDHFHAKGLKIHITEYDIQTDSEELHADWTRDFLILAYSHPAVENFTFWGFWDGRHWLPSGGLYRRDWTPKPAAIAYENLRRQWTTDFQLKTDAQGRVNFRGFPGVYDLQIWGADNKVSLSRVTLTTAAPSSTVKHAP